MTRNELEAVIIQATFRVWRAQPGAHDDWKKIRPIAKQQILAVGEEVMKEIEPYLDF